MVAAFPCLTAEYLCWWAKLVNQKATVKIYVCFALTSVARSCMGDANCTDSGYTKYWTRGFNVSQVRMRSRLNLSLLSHSPVTWAPPQYSLFCYAFPRLYVASQGFQWSNLSFTHACLLLSVVLLLLFFFSKKRLQAIVCTSATAVSGWLLINLLSGKVFDH